MPIQVSSLGVLTQLLDLSPDALLVVDQTGTIVMANAQTEALFGYSTAELSGLSLEMLLPPRFREHHRAHRERYFVMPRTRPMGVGLQLFGQHKDGTEFPVDISLRPLLLDGVLHAIGAIRDISRQHAAERERLQQAQHIRLQAELIQQAHDAIFVRDQINRILSWNQGAEHLYGWTEQEVLGRVSHTLLKTRFPVSRFALDSALEHDGRWEGELTHTCRDGRSVVVESLQALVRDEAGQPLAILEINRDITKRLHKAEADQSAHTETVERLTLLQQILDALPSSVYLVHGMDARLVLANRAAIRVWGVQWPVNQPLLAFLAHNGIEIVSSQGQPLPTETLATMQALRQGETVIQYQETIRHPDGTNLPVLVNAVALTPHHLWNHVHGQVAQQIPPAEPIALVVHQDITALKEAEYLKDEFVGIAAHELRTPLGVLAGYADMLLRQTALGPGSLLADWQQEALNEIKLAATRLDTLTEDLLDVTRLQAGRLHLQCTPGNVVTLVQRVSEQMQRTTTRHQLAVSVTHPALVADIDIRRTEQVLTNIIGNAIKYSPQGGPLTITVELEAATQAVRISVQDRGIGIPSHQQAQIFGRFIRADNTQAWSISGTGLGLYLCRELMERQGGRIWFESKEGKGSTFFVTFPLHHPEQEESVKSSASP